MKTYSYKSERYFFSLLAPVVLIFTILCYSIYMWFQSPRDSIYGMIITVLPLLLIMELWAINQPSKITDDGKYITFYAFGRSHRYKWDEIESLKLTTFPFNDRIYIRIGDNKALKGRYWINLNSMKDSRELVEKMKNLSVKQIRKS